MFMLFLLTLSSLIVTHGLETDSLDEHVCLLQKGAVKKSANTVAAGAAESDAATTTTTTTAACGFATPETIEDFFTNPAIKYKCEGFDLPKYHAGMLFGGGTTFLPLYSSLPMDVNNAKVTKVAIWFHGALCNAGEYFCEGMTSAEAAGALESTLVIAPLFFIYKILGKYWSDAMPADAVTPCWGRQPGGQSLTSSLWSVGGNSTPIEDGSGGEFTISSFTLIDKLIESFKPGGQFATSFPNIQKVSLMGFSEGASLMNKWSFFSDMPLVKQPLVSVIYGDATTYMYFDSKRPSLPCRAEENTGVEHKCDDFAVPSPDACLIYATNPPADTEIYGWSSTEIKGYNVYEYGLGIWTQDLDLYKGHDAPYGYVGKFLTDHASVEELLEKFPKKNIMSVQGAKDACNCGSINYRNMQNEWCYPTVNPPSIPPNPHTPFCTSNYFGGTFEGYTCCDTWPDSFAGGSGNDQAGGSCREMLGGTNRLQRAMNYKSHLEGFFAARGVKYTLPMRFFLGQHNSSAFSLSEAVAEVAYGEGWTM
mmetsp:Transcript_58428/g.90907  ORF Transcript_58428/g.90907 Transcript_58428/m.90907 type:complete len:535 (+) Transcript_58428:43-1647(+)